MRIFIDAPLKWLLSQKVTRTVELPVDEAFRHLVKVQRHQEWLVAGQIKRTSKGRIGLGSTFDHAEYHMFYGGRGGRWTHAELTVTEFVPAQRFAYEAKRGSLRLRRSFDLSPIGDGTRTLIAFREEVLRFGLGDFSLSHLTGLTLLLKPAISRLRGGKLVRWVEGQKGGRPGAPSKGI